MMALNGGRNRPSDLRRLLRLTVVFVVTFAWFGRVNAERPPEADDSQCKPGDCGSVDLAHAAIFAHDPFPSAKKCQQCHPKQYREWSVSPHAYAQLSPVFNAMSNTLVHVTNGTTGDFCIRCHTPVGMALDEPISMSNLDRHPTSREGVTCVVCHRINQAWGKGAGRQALMHGDLQSPVYGPTGSENLERVLADQERYGALKTTPNPQTRGKDVHSTVVPFFQQTTSGFCGACHDVFAPNGFRLEDAFSEFKASPSARKQRLSCQDCHMGKIPGEACGYEFGPAAVLGGVPTPSRKLANHMMVGPDYSIVHPGLFPHNPKAVREEGAGSLDPGLATLREWLLFDPNSPWGTHEFEESPAASKYEFPEPWRDPVRRYKARRVLDAQQKLLDESTRQRLHILRLGYQLSDVHVERADHTGVRFRVAIINGTNGHGVPTGFDAERVVFLRVLVWDRNGKLIFQSGDLDPNGDLRDSHSLYVHNGLLPEDRYITSLQSRFIVRSVRGGEREQVLVFPFSPDPLPYTRPETRPFTVLGRPFAARKHKQNIEVGGRRWGRYVITRRQLTGCGPYVARVQLIAGMVPANLVHAIEGVGFDYGMSAREVADAVVAGHLVLHQTEAVLHVDE